MDENPYKAPTEAGYGPVSIHRPWPRWLVLLLGIVVAIFMIYCGLLVMVLG